MSYTTFIDKQQGYVEVIHSGSVDLIESLRARDDVARLVKENSLHRAIFNLEKCQIDISTPDLYKFGSSFEQAGIPQSLMISGVVKSGDQKGRFLENVIHNRLMKIKFFTNRDEATEWLGLQRHSVQ